MRVESPFCYQLSSFKNSIRLGLGFSSHKVNQFGLGPGFGKRAGRLLFFNYLSHTKVEFLIKIRTKLTEMIVGLNCRSNR